MTTEVIGTGLDAIATNSSAIAGPMPAASSAGAAAAPGVSISVRTGSRRRAASPSRRVAVRHPAGVIRSPVCAAYAIVVPWWRPKPQRRPPSTPPQRSPRISTVGPKYPASHRSARARRGAARAADVRPRVRARRPVAKAVACQAGQAGSGARPRRSSPRDRGESSRTAAATSARSPGTGDSTSMKPCAHLRSARYSGDWGSVPGGRVREPEKLTRAPGTLMSTSASAMRDDHTPPVVGSPATAMCGMPARRAPAMAAATACICSRALVPSCIRDPPEAETQTIGRRSRHRHREGPGDPGALGGAHRAAQERELEADQHAGLAADGRHPGGHRVPGAGRGPGPAELVGIAGPVTRIGRLDLLAEARQAPRIGDLGVERRGPVADRPGQRPSACNRTEQDAARTSSVCSPRVGGGRPGATALRL